MSGGERVKGGTGVVNKGPSAEAGGRTGGRMSRRAGAGHVQSNKRPKRSWADEDKKVGVSAAQEV